MDFDYMGIEEWSFVGATIAFFGALLLATVKAWHGQVRWTFLPLLIVCVFTPIEVRFVSLRTASDGRLAIDFVWMFGVLLGYATIFFVLLARLTSYLTSNHGKT